MTDEQKQKLGQFAYCLGVSIELADYVLRNDEMLCEFGSKGCTKTCLEELVDAGRKVSGAFYSPPTRPSELH